MHAPTKNKSKNKNDLKLALEETHHEFAENDMANNDNNTECNFRGRENPKIETCAQQNIRPSKLKHGQ